MLSTNTEKPQRKTPNLKGRSLISSFGLSITCILVLRPARETPSTSDPAMVVTKVGDFVPIEVRRLWYISWSLKVQIAAIPYHEETTAEIVTTINGPRHQIRDAIAFLSKALHIVSTLEHQFSPS